MERRVTDARSAFDVPVAHDRVSEQSTRHYLFTLHSNLQTGGDGASEEQDFTCLRASLKTSSTNKPDYVTLNDLLLAWKRTVVLKVRLGSESTLDVLSTHPHWIVQQVAVDVQLTIGVDRIRDDTALIGGNSTFH